MLELPRVESRHARRLQKRNILRSRPVQYLMRHLSDSGGDRGGVEDGAANSAGTDIRVGVHVGRDGRGLGDHTGHVERKQDLAGVLSGMAGIENQ